MNMWIKIKNELINLNCVRCIKANCYASYFAVEVIFNDGKSEVIHYNSMEALGNAFRAIEGQLKTLQEK